MARRRTRGDGSAFQDKHGQWWAKIPLGNGKFRRARATDRKDAQAKLKQLITDRESGLDLRGGQRPVREWLEEWLEAKRGTVAERTLEFYTRHCEYMVPHIGHIKLESLEARHVRGMLSALRQTSLSAQSIVHVRNVLRNALNMAKREHLVRENVAVLIDAPSVPQFEANILTDNETTALLNAVDGVRRRVIRRSRSTGEILSDTWVEDVQPERWASLLHFVIALGFRRGEVIGLRWEDWDRNARTLRVRDAKTRSGHRVLPLSDDLNARLIEVWNERQSERQLPHWKESGHIFTSGTGSAIMHRHLNRWFDRIQEQAGLTRHFRLHDLRHTAITNWFAAGADPRAAQDLAGHASAQTTLRLYAKSRDDQRRDVIEKSQKRKKNA